jgi:hypothetical protein
LFTITPLQAKIFPCDGKYSDKEISELEKSWANVIKEKILPFLGSIELKFAQFFHKTMGRPIKYISLLIVMHIFKEMYDWTDQEMIEHIKFDKRFEFAFDLPYDELVVCQKTLYNFRFLIQQQDLARTIFDEATAYIRKLFNIDVGKQRIDSTHISSHMAKLSRLGLFVRVIENFLYKLKKLNSESYETLPARFKERYGQRRGYFADARQKKTKHRLGESATDMYYLIDRFRDDNIISSLKVMEHLKRVFEEQCMVRKSNDDAVITVNSLENEEKCDDLNASQLSEHSNHVENPKKVTLKEAKEVDSGSLQNPSDEDAAYGYKGQGYEATFSETCSENNPFQIITDTQVDPSNHSDQNTTVEVVDLLDEKGMKPETMYGDGGFVSGENIVECAERNVDLQGNLNGNDKEPAKLKLADFTFEEDGITVKACPSDERPVSQRMENARKPKSKADESFLVHFDLSRCKSCLLIDDCPTKLQKKKAVLRFSRKQVASSQRRREQNTKIFKERFNIRAGIESTNAEMKTRQGLSKLRVRGQPRVEQTVIFKALACNIKRMVKYVQSIEYETIFPQNAAKIELNPANC